LDVKKIYEFIDKKGIPFKKMSSIGISINENYEITKDEYPKQFIKIELPFDLNSEQQNQIVLDYIFDLTTFRFTDVNELLSKKALNNMPFILELNEHSNPKLFVAFKRIPGSLIIRGDQQYKDNGHKIKTLGNIESIRGDLGLSNTKIENLGKLKQIGGSLWFSGTDEFYSNGGFKIKILQTLEKVNGAVSIRGNSLESLGSLKYVGKNLSLRFSNVTNLGELEYVGGNLLISKYNIEHYDFSNIIIKGKIRKYNDKVQQLTTYKNNKG
jgi:hypothetical protein